MTTDILGEAVKKRRKALRMTQRDLAMASCTGVRFISDLENGKRGCEMGKAFDVVACLGLELTFIARPGA